MTAPRCPRAPPEDQLCEGQLLGGHDRSSPFPPDSPPAELDAGRLSVVASAAWSRTAASCSVGRRGTAEGVAADD